MVVEESRSGEMKAILPMLHMEPKMDFTIPSDDYNSPLYKTGERAGTLSTTGIYCLSLSLKNKWTTGRKKYSLKKILIFKMRTDNNMFKVYFWNPRAFLVLYINLSLI